MVCYITVWFPHVVSGCAKINQAEHYYVHEWHLTTATTLIATKGMSCYHREVGSRGTSGLSADCSPEDSRRK